MGMIMDPIKRTIDYNRELFGCFEEFFSRATGMPANEFATIGTFGEVIRKKKGRDFASNVKQAFQYLDTDIRPFYSRGGIDVFTDISQLGGMNLLIGGGSGFHQTHMDAVSTAILYSDTIMIPDPVLPWIESNREEERFANIRLLEAVHAILQLKPLVDADLPKPAIAVFPSWERTLLANDKTTQEGIWQMVADTISNSIQIPSLSIDDVYKYSDRNPERFCELVEQHHLVIAPGGSINDTLPDALTQYQNKFLLWNSEEFVKKYSALPINRKIIYNIYERISPVYHLLENAQELNGNPLIPIEQQAHYYRLVSQSHNANLERLDIIDPKTTALINAMGSKRLQWLEGIPVDTLAMLRMDLENVTFRKRLTDAVSRLHESEISNINRVTSEVSHEIEMAIGEYNKSARQIQQKYDNKHLQTFGVAAIALFVSLFPMLAPIFGGLPALGPGIKYINDKMDEHKEKHTLSHSLMGVLAIRKS